MGGEALHDTDGGTAQQGGGATSSGSDGWSSTPGSLQERGKGQNGSLGG